MFGAKAKEIKSLKLGMSGMQRQIEEWTKANAMLREKISSFEKSLATVEDRAHQTISGLQAERDQFAKRCEELEEKITRMLLERQAAQEASKEPLAFESPNPNSNETPV